MSRKYYGWSYASSPSNFVLWSDGQDFYVSRRVGTKRDSALRDHFVAFFAREQDAWASAGQRTLQRIDILNDYLKRFRREQQKSRKTK